MANFDKALNFVLQNEGASFTDDPSDSGGATKFGVTQKSYSDYLGRAATTSEIASLTQAEVTPFYLKYWNGIRGEEIKDDAIATAIFDCCVLYGTQPSVSLAQAVLGFVHRDGILGPDTLLRLNKEAANIFLDWYHYRLRLHIASIVYRYPKNEKFRQGWINRAEKLLTLKT